MLLFNRNRPQDRDLFSRTRDDFDQFTSHDRMQMTGPFSELEQQMREMNQLFDKMSHRNRMSSNSISAKQDPVVTDPNRQKKPCVIPIEHLGSSTVTQMRPLTSYSNDMATQSHSSDKYGCCRCAPFCKDWKIHDGNNNNVDAAHLQLDAALHAVYHQLWGVDDQGTGVDDAVVPNIAGIDDAVVPGVAGFDEMGIPSSVSDDVDVSSFAAANNVGDADYMGVPSSAGINNVGVSSTASNRAESDSDVQNSDSVVVTNVDILSKFDIIPSVPDGHCLIYALISSWAAQHPHWKPLTVDIVKHAIETETENNLDQYMNYFLGDVDYMRRELELYLNEKKYNTEFGDLLPAVVANYFNVDLKILDKTSAGVNLITQPCRDSESKNVLYVYRSGVHYDGLRKKDSRQARFA